MSTELPKAHTLADDVVRRRQEAAELEARFEEEKRRLIGCFKRLFSSADGELVLTHLNARFRRGDLVVPGDAVSTHVKVGERNVVEYIIKTTEVEIENVHAETGAHGTGG